MTVPTLERVAWDQIRCYAPETMGLMTGMATPQPGPTCVVRWEVLLQGHRRLPGGPRLLLQEAAAEPLPIIVPRRLGQDGNWFEEPLAMCIAPQMTELVRKSMVRRMTILLDQVLSV